VTRGPRQLRVRTAHHYPVSFVIDLGQRNAVFIKRPLTPLNRFFRWADAATVLPEPGYDLVHSLNAVPLLTRRPYVITFESFLPRVPEDRYIGWLERFLQQRLATSSCRALIAMSDYALRQFRRQNREFQDLDLLERKLRLIYPAVRTRRADPKKHSPRKLRLLFVGNNFMGKGGPAVLRAHEELRRERLPLETIVVSALQWSPNDHVGPPSHEYVQRELRLLGGEGLTHHANLANHEVLTLMDRADYFVFPTLHDTFGYAPLEALAGGTPVIATDVCAQPEIAENGRSGYLLPIEKDSEVGKWRHLARRGEAEYQSLYEQAVASLTTSLADALRRCWEDKSRYEELSGSALDRARSRFAPEYARNELEDVYETCRS
jgi:glycosyltransferase involved in cell wall biosynthesis